jgi:hypothetical protein
MMGSCEWRKEQSESQSRSRDAGRIPVTRIRTDLSTLECLDGGGDELDELGSGVGDGESHCGENGGVEGRVGLSGAAAVGLWGWSLDGLARGRGVQTGREERARSRCGVCVEVVDEREEETGGQPGFCRLGRTRAAAQSIREGCTRTTPAHDPEFRLSIERVILDPTDDTHMMVQVIYGGSVCIVGAKCPK